MAERAVLRIQVGLIRLLRGLAERAPMGAEVHVHSDSRRHPDGDSQHHRNHPPGRPALPAHVWCTEQVSWSPFWNAMSSSRPVSSTVEVRSLAGVNVSAWGLPGS